MRMLLVTLVLACAGTLAVDLEPGAAPRAAPPQAPAPARAVSAPKVVQVAFVRGDRLVRVERPLPKGVVPAWHALRQLLRGPTLEEWARGLRSGFGPGTVRIRSVTAERNGWRVSFSRGLLGPATRKTVQTRLAQIGATLSRLGGSRRFAAISAAGRLTTVVRLGLAPDEWMPAQGENGYAYSVRGVQLRLWTLGYLERADVSAELDYTTSQALLAFQGWEGLVRTGTVTGQTQLALFSARPPRPTAFASGRRIEIHRDRGVVLLLQGNDVRRAIHTSTGAGGVTPTGAFRVYRKEFYFWSVPFQVWMPYASYFLGGYAMHEYPEVPAYPASHGCVRLPAGEARRVYGFARIGTPVRVF
jgi:hypothetical protein